MILERIKLKDFRCFHGEASISFSTDPKQNVTIIYAENGVGKTTLLNALLWCFYGDTTERFEKREDIVNYDAKQAGRAVASVEVQFEHDKKQYVAKRFSSVNGAPSREFVVARIENGSHHSLDLPDTFINTVIPHDMAPHFLFDGEHAEVFLGESNRGSIEDAVRDILGCSLIETAIEDLQAVSNQFRKKIPSTAATKQIEECNRELDSLVAQIAQAKENITELKNNYDQTRQQIKDIDAQLRNTAGAKELQGRRDSVETQLARAKSRHKDCEGEVYKWLGENGWAIVSKRITEEALKFLDEKQHRGRIPSPYNEEFVKDILEAEECICGAKLAPGSAESKKVASLLDKAANQVMRDRVSKVRARLSRLKAERAKAPRNLTNAKQRLAQASDDISKNEAELAEISKKLKDIDFDDIAAREQRRSELEGEFEEIVKDIGRLEGNINNSERDKTRIDNELNEIAKKDTQTAIYGRRRNLCETIRGNLELRLTDEENRARKVLRASIKKVLAATTRKALKLKMTDDYVISLVNAHGAEMPKSGGENQLLGLAFTAALVGFAKARENAQDRSLLPGTIAPLVLDSPFGQLDEAYRATTAEFIPKMASQVILLVSTSQGSKDVLNALESHLGAEYLLVRHNKESRDGRKRETRHIKGKEFETAVFESEFDGTEIVGITDE